MVQVEKPIVAMTVYPHSSMMLSLKEERAMAGAGELTAELLRTIVHYDPETGIFTWRVRAAQRIHIGDMAGNPDTAGYLGFWIKGRRYLSHRLAWLYMTGQWPPCDMDHKDLDKSNNRWGNLRLATESQNAANRHRLNTNTSGYKGAYWHKRQKKWNASIRVAGKTIHLGCFDRAEDAGAAYAAAAPRYFGEFARSV